MVVSFTSGCRFIDLPNIHQTDESRFSHQSVWGCSGSTALWALWILLICSILFQHTSVSIFHLPDGTPRYLDRRLAQFLSNWLVTCNLMQKLESHFFNQFMNALAALHDGNFGFFRFEAFFLSVLPYRSFIRYMAHATASSLAALRQCWFNWLVQFLCQCKSCFYYWWIVIFDVRNKLKVTTIGPSRLKNRYWLSV